MKTIYLDIFSGLSGDMFLGVLIDLVLDPQELEKRLTRLGVHGYRLHVSREKRGQIQGNKFDVHLEEPHEHGHGHDHHHHHTHHPARTFADIKKLICAAGYSRWVEEKAVRVFQRIAEAEGKIHGHPPDQVHFHEVGAVDSIIDIVGVCLGLELLGCPRILSGPVLEGTGTIRCQHGCFPLPAPATLEILGARRIPIQQCEEPHELVTPTGAGLLAEFAESFAPLSGFTVEKIGYGLGARENKTRPNVVRALLGESAKDGGTDWETDTVCVLQTNLDDINPEIIGAFMEKALASGALDVFYTPIQMKKNRPGVLLSVLTRIEDADSFSRLVLQETSAFGVRRTSMERRKLHRESRTVVTPFGEVTVKLGRLGDQVLQVAPEYEACKALAEKNGVPLKNLYEAALQAARIQLG